MKRLERMWANERKATLWLALGAVALLATWVFIVFLWVAAGMLWYMTLFNIFIILWSGKNYLKLVAEVSRQYA